ncbi:MAG: hypothetical protein ACK5N0_07645 [Synechococcaceae cyanobacterium]
MIWTVSAYTSLYFTKLVAAFQGISHSVGWVWAVLAIIAGMGCRVVFPLTVGAYWHAMSAWDLHPAVAALLATGPETWLEIEEFTSYRNRRAGGSPSPSECAWILNLILSECLVVALLVAGFRGIQNSLSLQWAILSVIAKMYGFSLPIIAGGYIQATKDWSWHPAIALLFVAGPTLCQLIQWHIIKQLLGGQLPLTGRVWGIW